MKIRVYLLGAGLLLAPMISSAETEEEEMMRIQQELNSRLFGTGKEEQHQPPPPPPAPVQASAPAPAPVAEPAVTEALPLTHFTNYRLAGLHVGLSKADVFAVLKKEGYNCNIQAAKQMEAIMGRTVCIYASMASPKIVMMTFINDALKDFEMEEEYKTGFPEKFFAKEKNNFIKKYGNEAQCKTQRRGEICEVFGHGYRIMLQSKYRDDKASITHSFSTL